MVIVNVLFAVFKIIKKTMKSEKLLGKYFFYQKYFVEPIALIGLQNTVAMTMEWCRRIDNARTVL